MHDPPMISLCMISLNEAAMIGDAIRSCAGAVDEIVVVDHGSTDGTQEIARSLGAKVIERKWTDSYADARNASFANATGDWIIVLCCDERLEPESARMLRRVITDANTEALTVLFIDETRGGDSLTRYVRIGQRADIPPMIRRVHEQFTRAPKSLAESPLRIRHLGHCHGPNITKLKHYCHLLELQLSETPNDHYIQINLLHTYWILNDPRWEKIMEQASAGLDHSTRAPHPMVAVLLELAMLRKPAAAPAAISPTDAAALAEKWYPTFPPLVALRIRQALGQKDASTVIKLADSIFSRPPHTIDPIPYQRGYIEADIHLLAGAACVIAGDRRHAAHHFRQAARHQDIAEIAKTNLKRLGENI